MPDSAYSLPASQPSRDQFMALAQTHTLVPLYLTLNADLETPVTAFLRLTADDASECFLLESVEGGEKIGRYTFIGVRPFRKIIARGTELTVSERGTTTRLEGDVFETLQAALSGHTPARLPGLPPFTAGAVGFFAYDVVRQIEQLPATAVDELHVPDACLLFFDEVLAFDYVRKEMVLIVTADVRERGAEEAYAAAQLRLEDFAARLARPIPESALHPPVKPGSALAVVSRTSESRFLDSIAQAKEYIAAGDIFQVVLSQRFDVTPGVDPFRIYRSLRVVNPSPYMYFLRLALDDTPSSVLTHIVGSSPELLVRVTGDKVEYRPIAGTRPRSADEEEDRQIAEELLADEKERSEHVMLVDLGRNDVGRVSEFGSVRVRDLMHIERYSHVMHIVSAIEGRLRKDLDAVDAFRACFPAGTLSGAPKIRAMEIIEELEPARRGVYGGAVFYADYSGNFDSCIAIRTLLLQGEPGQERGCVQAGAGIVADSVPEREHEECQNKAKAVLRAIERARG
ncbi:anthranilate synthase component I [Acidipila sp. EB88]|uniref:anthranilate synthase component I n=1 Tax=Acidipila sp. EB88 TaxID=2305226 RepID=UPI000F5F2794|nr:anthranilate synthase component I [Acidipila sp. EB88]RRA49953.1 anthranilate synthase component I [Acidipila sp. EB88]